MTSLALLSAPAFAGKGGSGGIGGGERVGKYLRDLMDNGTCTIQDSQEFTEKYANNIAEVLGSIEGAHWVFARHLAQEISCLKFCVVRGKLKRIRTNDVDDLTFYTLDNRAEMLAIRADNTVYVDQAGLANLSRDMRAYLVIHEAMHGFVASEERRNHKVRNIVYNIAQNAKEPMSPKKFALQMQHSAIFLSTINDPRASGYDVEPARPIIADYDVALDEGAPLESRKEAALRIHQFCPNRRACDGVFRHTEYAKIEELVNLYQQDFSKAFEAGDIPGMQKAVAKAANPNLPGVQGQPLRSAVLKGNLAIVEFLLSLPGIEVKANHTDDYFRGRRFLDKEFHPKSDPVSHAISKSALYLAIESKNMALIRLILNHPGTNVNDASDVLLRNSHNWYLNDYDYYRGPSALIAAVETGQKEQIEAILAHPTYDPSVSGLHPHLGEDDRHWRLSAIDIAVGANRPDLVARLLKAGEVCQLRCARIRKDRQGRVKLVANQ